MTLNMDVKVNVLLSSQILDFFAKTFRLQVDKQTKHLLIIYQRRTLHKVLKSCHFHETATNILTANV